MPSEIMRCRSLQKQLLDQTQSDQWTEEWKMTGQAQKTLFTLSQNAVLFLKDCNDSDASAFQVPRVLM